MSDLTTGLAEIGQGVLTARAIEPRAGEGAAKPGEDGHTHEHRCLNCGTGLIGPHCHRCGQGAHVHRTLGAFFHDLAHGVFHVEGKIWHTLPLLLLHPGRLTREYIDGRRARYLSPIALFLFGVFLLFAVFHLVEGKDHEGTDAFNSVDQAIAGQIRQLDRLEADRDLAATAAERKRLDARIASTREEIAGLRRVNKSDGDDAAGLTTKISIAWINRAVTNFRANPDLALYKLQMSAYKYSWMLIPISVPLVWLLFPFSRHFRLYDHTVFVTYSLAAMTLLACALTLLDLIAPSVVALLAMFLPPVHLYRQVRGTYGTGRLGALWRTVALTVFAGSALTLFTLGLLSLGLLG